jgi:hypothetical protein
MSNFAYSQIKIAEYINAFFAMIAVGCCIVASEINSYHNIDDLNKDFIIIMLTIANVSTAFLSKF